MSMLGLRHRVRHQRRQVEQAAREARPWVIGLARFGFVAKGVVYIVIGLLALQAAIGPGGKTSDGEGALKTILVQPFGQFLLGGLAVGLFGFSLWRIVQAFLDPEGKGTDAKGIIKRIGYALSGAAYGGLALTALRLIVGLAGGREGSIQDWTAAFLTKPFGPWLVGAAGLVVLGIALNSFYLAYSAKFREKLKRHEMSPAAENWAARLGRLGLAARGISISLIGIFLVQAAVKADPNEARGLSGTLAALARQPHGPWLLGVVAAGFVAYGLYMFVEAKCRRVYL